MYNLYDVLQKDTAALESAFNEQVREQTALISQELSERLTIDSILQFKGSFRDLFNTLEFGSNDGKSMLSQRGDGIKIRHIPIILQNIAEAELRENRSREPIASTIWGFEEPENNLEYDSAKKLAESFIEYVSKVHFQDKNYSRYDEGIQIFITTHSPVFYTLSNSEDPRINSFYVKKQKDESSDIRPISSENSLALETEMKLLPLFELSKHWKNINKSIDSLRNEKLELERELESFNDNCKCIFLTEDKKIGLVELLISSNGFNLDEVDLRTYKGCTNIGSAEVLNDYLKDKFGDRSPQIVVHRDKDYSTKEEIEKELEKYSKLGIDLFITSGTDVESYFVRFEHLKYCLNDKEEEVLRKIIMQAKAEKKSKALDMLRLKEFGQNNQNKSSHLQSYMEQCYTENEECLFHGKEVYRRVKSLFQEKYKSNAMIDNASDFLSDKNLKLIANKIWN
jgi:hypothetical protein